MANEFKVRKGLIVQGSGSNIFDVQGSQGQLFSITDSLSGSLFSVNDISGIPIMEVFSDNTIKLGTFNQEAIIVSGSRTGMGIATPQAELHISGANNDSLFRIQSPASASIMFVSGSGLVGIGTATPTQKISVDTGNVGFTSGFGISWDSDTEWIKRAAASDQLQLATQNTVRLNIGSTQGQLVAIGLGATAASAQFQVRGGGATSATTAMRIEDSGGNARLTILDNGTSAFNTSHLYVSSSGRVGIGTTNPRAALHISAGDISLDGTRYLDWANGDNRIIGGSAGGFSLQFHTWTGAALTEKMRISGSGEVGIGVTNMTAKLHVSGASNAGLFEIDSPAVNNIIYVSGSGNVGIGTGTPTNTLQVVGGITATSITASIISASSGITGSLLGTSSWAQSASNAINAQTASFLPVGTYQITSSWAQSASNAINAQTASFLPVGTYQITSSWAQSASNAINAQTASFLPVETYQITSSWAVSASNSINARTSSNIFPAITNNTSSYVLTATGNGTINGNSNLTFDGSNLTLGSFTGIVLPSNGYVKGPQNTVLLGGNATYNVSIPNDFVTATASFGFPSSTRIQLLTNVESIPGGYDSGSIFFKTPSGSGMTYTNEGRLGIGISNPTNTLQIQGNVSASSYTGSLFGTSSWATNALTASNITPSITNNTDNRVLTATGGGTINGESNLTFDGSVLTVTGRANISTSITSSTATVGFGLTSALNAGQTTIRGSGVDTVGALTIQNSGGTAVFTVLNGGTTGVGENNPSARLHVKGSGATSATTALRVENSAATARLTILDDGTSAFNTSHLYVSSSGLVGVGTALPTAKLHISGASVDSLLRVGSPTNSDILFVNGNGRVGINTTSSTTFLGGSNISTFTIFQNSGSGDGLTPSTGLQIINSGSSTSAQAQLSIVTVGDKFAAFNIGTSGSGTQNNYWHLSKRNAANGHALNLYNNNNGTFSGPLFSFVSAGTSTLGEYTQIQINDITGRVGLQTTPSDYIHLYSEPGTNYLRIDATSVQAPPVNAASAKNGYGIIANDYFLAEPDYWMEIKLDANVVLIPCYLPA